MIEFKGTKGKWTLAKFKTKVFHKPKENWMPIQPIAYISEVSMNREERTANAMLISKAPEMLSMLERCFSMCDKLIFPTEQELKDISIDIKQLIKEATEL